MEELFWQYTLQEAWKFQGLTLPNPAVGAALLGEHGELIALSAHQKAGMPHAEVLTLQKAYSLLKGDKAILSLVQAHDIHDYLLKNHQGIFECCSLLVTLEPCSHTGKTPSCALLLAVLRLKTVVVGMADESLHAQGGADILRNAGISVEFLPHHNAFFHLLYPFKRLQENQRFIFYKFATRLNGSIDQGVISSHAARTLTHHFRGAIDLLVISGKTVREDRPILDTRFAPHCKPPHVLIITSKPESLDHSIPLFNVPNRKVHIASNPKILDSLEKLGDYHTVMIEGGSDFFKSVEPYLDMIAVFVSSNLSDTGCVRVFAQERWALWHTQFLNGRDAHDDSNALLWLGRNL